MSVVLGNDNKFRKMSIFFRKYVYLFSKITQKLSTYFRKRQTTRFVINRDLQSWLFVVNFVVGEEENFVDFARGRCGSGCFLA